MCLSVAYKLLTMATTVTYSYYSSIPSQAHYYSILAMVKIHDEYTMVGIIMRLDLTTLKLD